MKLGKLKELITNLPDGTEVKVNCMNWSAPLIKVMYDGENLILGDKSCHREPKYGFKKLKQE